MYTAGVLGIIPGTVGFVAGAVGWVGVLVSAVLGLAGVVWRCVRGRGTERAALAVVLGVGAVPTVVMLALTAAGVDDQPETYFLPWVLCLGLLVPGSILVAALVSEPGTPPPLARRLVLAALTAAGVLMGIAASAAVGVAVAGTTLGPVAGIGAAGLTLLALAWPGRLARLGVLRLLYGRRDAPFSLVRQAAARAGAVDDRADALRRMLVELCTGLRVSGVAVRTPDATVVAAHGVPVEPSVEVPLVDAAGPVGHLLVGARSAGEPLTAADRDVLAALAPHLAALAADSLLVQRLRGSRTRIVLAREEERRRLRRDLHDSLGAALSGIGYGLDAAALADAAQAPQRLAAVRAQLTDVQSELRRIIEALRPSILDSAGLAAAVRADAQTRDSGRTRIDVTAGALGALPAAVELVGYRVVQEAVTNALQHTAADHVHIGLHSDGRCLTVTVRDDGIGLPRQRRTGVGLASMAERVSEVGGTVTVAAVEPGTEITARLPLAASHEDGAGGPVPSGDGRP